MLIGLNLKIIGKGLKVNLKIEIVELINYIWIIYYD